jgi:tRNA U34 5-methylaminomethyl-2-thiouridine-forming methyltransferase MnmC
MTTLRCTTTADGSRTLVSERWGESYRSLQGAHTEARHVFVAGSGVATRLADGRDTVVLEVGLGGATNFVATAAVALSSGARLRHHAFDPALPSAEDWAALDHATLAPAPFVAALLAARRTWSGAGVARFDHGPVTLIWHPAPIVDRPRQSEAPSAVDAVYLDAFSPASNPDAWTAPVLSDLAAILRPGGTLVTYSVAGRVRRALAEAGLRVERRPGPAGGKREMLFAQRPA